MAGFDDSPSKRHPRAANASFWDKVKQTVDATSLRATTTRLASGLPLSPDHQRWLDKLQPSIRDAIMACKQEDSRFLPAGYLREEMADLLPRRASQADRDERLRRVNPRAYRGRIAQREAARDALVAAGVPKAVAAIISDVDDPMVPPTTVEAMRAALERADALLMARATKAAEAEMPEATRRADQATAQEAWARAEWRAKRLNRPELLYALRERQGKAKKGLLDLTECWDALERAVCVIVFSHEAERVEEESRVPKLAAHLLAMREAIVAEHSPRYFTIEQPQRVPGAGVAWRAMAEFHNISVATLRQRGEQLPRMLEGLEEREDQAKAQSQARKEWPPRDRRQRGRRKP